MPLRGSEPAHLPKALFPALLARLRDRELDEGLKTFLGERAGDTFLRLMVTDRPNILEWAATTTSTDPSLGSLLLLAALNSYRLLPEEVRVATVDRMRDNTLDWVHTKVFFEDLYRQISTKDEFDDLAARFRVDYLLDPATLFGQLNGSIYSDDEKSLFENFKEDIARAETFFFRNGRPPELDTFYVKMEAHISRLEEEDEPSASEWSELSAKSASLAAASVAAASSTIFDDVDD